MNYAEFKVTFQEIPDEICLTFLITGCQVGCKGCHSKYAWNADQGEELTAQGLSDLLNKYSSAITCVLFLGGEWHSEKLITALKQVRRRGFKTALYTGLDDIQPDIKKNLNYLKVGRWISELGGLRSSHTNQKLYDLDKNIIVKFNIKENNDVTT